MSDEDIFRIVCFRDELRLVPVPDDPVEDLRRRTENVRESNMTVDELREETQWKM